MCRSSYGAAETRRVLANYCVRLFWENQHHFSNDYGEQKADSARHAASIFQGSI